MSRYSHQFLISVTVESDEKDPDKLTRDELERALYDRTKDIHGPGGDGIEAFQHNDTEENQ